MNLFAAKREKIFSVDKFELVNCKMGIQGYRTAQKRELHIYLLCVASSQSICAKLRAARPIFWPGVYRTKPHPAKNHEKWYFSINFGALLSRLLGRLLSSRLRGSIALNLSFQSAWKWAPYAQYICRRRRKTKIGANGKKNRKNTVIFEHFDP